MSRADKDATEREVPAERRQESRATNAPFIRGFADSYTGRTRERKRAT